MRTASVLRLAALSSVLLAALACEESTGPEPRTAKSLPPDRTEVKMERIENFDPDSGTVGPVASTTAATSTTATPPPDAAGGADAGAAAWTGDPTEDPMIGGRQDPKVEKAVAPHRQRIRACYKKERAKEAGLVGSATFDVTIGAGGKVASARFVKREGLNEDMVGCLLAAIKGMTFDAGDKSQIVALSFGAAPSSDPAKH